MSKRNQRSVFVYRCNVLATGPVVTASAAHAVFRTPSMLLDFSVMATHPGWTRSDRQPDVAWYVWSTVRGTYRLVGGLFDAAGTSGRRS